MTNLLEMLSIDANETRSCPDCGGTLRVGVENSEVSWKCENCECVCIDGRNDLLQDVLLSPREIRSIRKTYSLSRRELSKLTRFGEKSIKRWETGEVRQNASANRFLQLLRLDSSAVEKLRALEARSK